MPRSLRYLVSLLLGVCTALLAACAGNTKGGLPAASASDLKSQLEDIRERVDAGRCGDLNGQLRQIDDRIDALPASADERLKQALRDGVTRLRSIAPRECNENDTATQTQTTPPALTETTPDETETIPTTTLPTTTVPPPTETDVPPTTIPSPPPPPPVEPPPPPVAPGGGTPPEIP